MRKGMRSVWISGNVLGILIAILLLLFQAFRPLDFAIYDSNMKMSMSHQPHGDIIVVGLDERSFAEIGLFPWDRKVYAEFLERLNRPENRPRAIAFDISFASESDPESDWILAEQLARHDNVIFPSTANLQGEFSRTTTVRRDELIMARGLEKPIEPFARHTHNAHINAIIDPDRAIRRTWLQLNTPEDGVIDSLALKAVKLAGYDPSSLLARHPQTEILIDFQATSYDFLTISFVQALNDEFPLANFKDSIVLVGFNAPGTERDNRSTPVETDMMLVFAHANIVNQLINDSHIRSTSKLFGAGSEWVTLLSMLAMMALGAWITWKARTMIGVMLLFLLAIAIYVVQYILFSRFGLHVNSVYPLAGLFLAYLVNIAIKSYFEAKQRNYITKQFGRYISPDLVREIAASGQEIRLGGINKELSILFLDIRGFTTLSEKLRPEQVVDFLNMMFNLITEKTLANKGTIDKFIGDAAMIMFNAPLDVEHHEYYAVKTAYDIQRGMEVVRREIEEKYGVTISIGIGIHTGEVVVGNIGSYLRVDYTAIGDNVNIAARIESNTVANQILVSEETYERTKDDFEYNCIGERLMKGKTVPVKLYEVIDFKGGV